MTLTPEQNEILDLRDKVHELEQTILDLRRRICGRCLYNNPTTWDLRPAAFEIAVALATSPDGHCSMIELKLRGCKSQTVDKTVVHYIWEIKKKLAWHCIEIEPCGNGFRIDDVSREHLLADLEEAGRVII